MRILSIDGGGYLGLSSAAFLAGLERHLGRKCCDTFDFFCGTSTGAIIALAIAKGLPAADVVQHYRELGTRVFPDRSPLARWVRTWIRGAFRARYSLDPLREALNDVFGDVTLGDVAARGKYALVAAFNVSAGLPRIFKTDHSPNLTDHNRYRLADIALASSAAPLFFPLAVLPHPSNGAVERFCDGGVFANSPAMLAYAEAVKELHIPPECIDILSLSTPRVSLAERRSAKDIPLSRGILGWRLRLAQVMVDGTSAVSDGALSRIIASRRTDGGGYCRIRLAGSEGLELDIATPAATESLIQIGSEAAEKSETRQELRRFFCERIA